MRSRPPGPAGTTAWNKWRTTRNRAIENPARLVIDLKAPTRSQLAAIWARIELDPDIEIDRPRDEPLEDDGECYRGNEAAAALAESQFQAQRLK
jgi:hypothetical protein